MRDLLNAAPKLEHRTADLSDEEVMALLDREGTFPEGWFSRIPIVTTWG
ncbi:hypothetical protein HSBAA_25420 [Vreelandella sulfidaeris]|uniref:Uncharacterized protein n=1 Tax=Vreelandella sulfidaeris TaxID=115553 RepID=A0A455U554_9GAMM|nr:hypothetical protein HSBAA_25420 [Halomonas sulfidaeris]